MLQWSVITSLGIFIESQLKILRVPEWVLNSAQANGADQLIGSCDSFPKAVFSCLTSQAAFPSVRFNSTFRGLTRVSAVITFREHYIGTAKCRSKFSAIASNYRSTSLFFECANLLCDKEHLQSFCSTTLTMIKASFMVVDNV